MPNKFTMRLVGLRIVRFRFAMPTLYLQGFDWFSFVAINCRSILQQLNKKMKRDVHL